MRQLRDEAFKVLEFDLCTVPEILRAVLDQHDPAKGEGKVQAKPGHQPREHGANMSRLPCVRNLPGSERAENVFRPMDNRLSF